MTAAPEPSHPSTAPTAPRRRRALRTALVVVPAVLVVAGAASFVTVLVTDHGGRTTAGTGTAAAAPLGTAKHATVGTVTAQDGSSWQVRTAAGRTVSVDVGSSTAFGTRAHPSPESAFHTGADVKVVGTHQGATVDAQRVVLVTGAKTT